MLCEVKSCCCGLVAADELDRHAAQPEEFLLYTTLNHTIVAWPI